MNCQDFDAILLDLARGKAANSAREKGRAHARTCARCAALLSEQRMLSVGLKALAARAEEDRAPQRIESALRAEFCRFHARVRGPGGHERQYETLELACRASRNRWAWALAAIVMVATAWVMAEKLLFKPRATPLTQTQPQQAALSGAPRSSVLAVANARPLGEHPASGKAFRRVDSRPRAPVHSRLAARAQNSSNGRATDFYSLPYSSGLDLDEGWEIVRLDMPVSALASLSVPVINEGTSTHYVTADVVLGGDGIARAIRFVQ